MTDKPPVLASRVRSRIALSEASMFWLIGLGICLLGVVLRALIGPLLIDDAYIYFRYALNAAAGKGLVYNPGQLVFGATSPPYTLILTLAAVAGLNLIPASVIFGIVLDFASSVILLVVGRKLGTDFTGWLSALFFSLAPKAVIPGLSGMETSFFTLLVTLCLAGLIFRRRGAAIVLAGLAGATRPEGLALLGVVVAYAALEERRVRWRATLFAALPTVLWLVLSSLMYHAWIPNSINAKAVVFPRYPNPFHDSILIVRYLTNPFEFTSTEPVLGWINLVVLCVAGIGLIILVRRSRAVRPFVLWCVIIAMAYALVNRSMFPWYLGPFFPLSSIVLAYALGKIAEFQWLKSWSARSFPYAAGAFGASALLILGILFWTGSAASGNVVRLDQDHRERTYLRLGEWLAAHLPSNSTVASAEIGAIGYGYPGPILDFTGLVSPEVLPYFAAPGFVFHYPHTLPAAAVERFAPPVLVTYDKFITDFSGASWFNQAYPNVRTLEIGHPVYGTLMVFTAPGVPIPREPLEANTRIEGLSQ